MMAAQQHQVVHPRLAAVGPMSDVVRIDVEVIEATRKAAALIAVRQRAADRGRNVARASANVQQLAILAFLQRHERGIADQASRRLRRNRAAMFDMAAVTAPFARQCRTIHAHHDLVALGLP